jgi:hypothetical protein
MFPDKRMHTTRTYYIHAFAIHALMNDFLIDLGDRRGWGLLANILRIRYASAFTAFLDQPTLSRLAAVLAFNDEMTTIGASMPAVRPGYQELRGDSG